jgi:hypothetical protein
MSPQLEQAYRAANKKTEVALQGLVSIYRDSGVAQPVAGEPPATGRPKLTAQARDSRVNDVRGTLKPEIEALSKLTMTQERLTEIGKTLLQLHADDALEGKPASRALLFAEDPALFTPPAKAAVDGAMRSLNPALTMSRRIPVKLHASASSKDIRLYQNGEEIKKLGPFELPFKKQSYRADPTKPAGPTNREYPPEQWQTFVFNEVFAKHPEISTTTLFAPTYQTGQNLQWANVVVHLDRDTFSDFNMTQREKRVLRPGQTRPVTVIYSDYVFAQPTSSLDRTIDEVRALQQTVDRRLLKQTLVAAQKITLGEGLAPARAPNAFNGTVAPQGVEAPAATSLPTENDLGLFALAAVPTAIRVGLSSNSQ